MQELEVLLSKNSDMKLQIRNEILRKKYPWPSSGPVHVYIDHATRFLESEFVSMFPYIHFENMLEGASDDCMKSNVESEKNRLKGNDLYKLKDYSGAHDFYTYSIALAETKSEQMSLAYGNRSAVLYQMCFYKECIEDIDRALAMNYPEDKKNKLLDRKSKATKLAPTQKKFYLCGKVPQVVNANDAYPNASSCIELKENEEFGQHFVAAKNIEPGEVLLVEKPEVSWLYVEERPNNIHCSGCLKLCHNLIPCELCPVLYCSEECKLESFKEYHSSECSILRYYGHSVFPSYLRYFLKKIRRGEFQNYQQIVSIHYAELDALDKDIMSHHLFRVAELFHYFKNFTSVYSKYDVDENNLKTCMWNIFHEMYVTKSYISALKICGEEFGIGGAIYPTLKFFKHACTENAIRFFFDSTIVIKARTRIKRGETCFISYYNARLLELSNRTNVLKKIFGYTCKCHGCLKNWSLESNCRMDFSSNDIFHRLAIIFREVSTSKKMEKHQRTALLNKTLKVLNGDSTYLRTFNIYALSTYLLRQLLADGNNYDNIVNFKFPSESMNF